jgi:hypothetical protein
MRLKEIRQALDAQWISKAKNADSDEQEVLSCQASDLISDILSLRGPGSLLLTGLTNTQVIRTADILDFVAICFVRGKLPQPETIRLAEEKGIPLLATPHLMFEACGLLYDRGLPAGTRREASSDS